MACDYIEALNRRREDLPAAEVSLAEIKGALFAWFGIKKPNLDNDLAKISSAGMPVASVSKKALDAWTKAGMPSPPEKFFKEFDG